jgi:hypothetical protein
LRRLSRLPLSGVVSHSWRSRTFQIARFDMGGRLSSQKSRSSQGSATGMASAGREGWVGHPSC